MEIFITKIPITKAFCKFVQIYKMQRLVYIIFISFFLLFSCAKQKPKGVLSEQKMTDLLTEVSLIDAYLNTLPIDSGRKMMPVLYSNLFEQFDIDSALYVKNMDYYYGNPILTDKIYTEIQKKLFTYEKTYRTEDSLRNIVINDSVRLASRRQRLQADQNRLIRGYYPDNRELDIRERSIAFFNDIDLQVNAYGLQIPAIPQDPIVVLEDPIMQDSVLRMYLDVPMHNMLLKKPNDSIAIDPRFRHIFFLRNAGLKLNTGFTFAPRVKTVGNADSTVAKETSLDSTAVNQPDANVQPISTESEAKLKPLGTNNEIRPNRRLRNSNDLVKTVPVQ